MSRWIISVVAVLATAAVVALAVVRFVDDDSRRQYLGDNGWPAHGQAAYVIEAGPVHASPQQRAVPIASLAKVMTALLVLRSDPLPGVRLRVTATDVADRARRAARGESTVPVHRGEWLTERQALAAVLLPSANNVAIMLARRVAGSVAAFVARMNATARALGLRHTHYTDPSGFDAGTRSTAADQVILAGAAMRNRSLADLVGRRSFPLPVAGTVHNTDSLLGSDGFVGIKTGSMDAAGGCFMFRVRRTVGGRELTITGVVLHQQGHNLIDAGLYAARQLADHVARTTRGRIRANAARLTESVPQRSGLSPLGTRGARSRWSAR